MHAIQIASRTRAVEEVAFRVLHLELSMLLSTVSLKAAEQSKHPNAFISPDSDAAAYDRFKAAALRLLCTAPLYPRLICLTFGAVNC